MGCECVMHLTHAYVGVFSGGHPIRGPWETSSNQKSSTVQWAARFCEYSGVHRSKTSPIDRTFPRYGEAAQRHYLFQTSLVTVRSVGCLNANAAYGAADIFWTSQSAWKGPAYLTQRSFHSPAQPWCLRELRQALSASDLTTMTGVAHAVTGASGNLGVHRARAAARQPELLGNSGHLARATAAHTTLEAE
jgi:hypothetical protein